MKKQLVLGVLISSLTVSAHAYQDLSAEVLLGISNQRTDFGDGDRASGDSTSFGLRGAYSFNPNVAVELSYQNYGSYDDRWVDEFGRIDETFKSSALMAGVKMSLPLQAGYSLVGRVGASHWNFELEEIDSEFPGEVFVFDDSGTGLYYGVGVQLDITQDLFIGVEYTATQMDVTLGGFSVDHRARNIAASLGFRF
ncbi:porin family protein [Marinimicrobium sp. ABcell2]|uniref:porin family protein n=1 Tax=Marinimicrobium sp. ABcell2 TaxID=3069751 RepID=UPI0027B0B146|nr:porin family protein [Marinimicrobium sp. ABcell2]MDQ2078143.1 porin family protein [Marinimicrobium sp. ABcell2]